MKAPILHSGFDGLKFTLQTEIPPELREKLCSAKQFAKEMQCECLLEFGSVALSVTNKGARGFTGHTGDLGAVWLFQDPEDRIPNNPGITVDFRAFGLATGGLVAAEEHFRSCMNAFGIKYVETQLRVSRADFAVDFLAPWFEPNREALVVPPGTIVTEYTGVDETATISSGARIMGLRAGAVANRQLVIYDKRAEVIKTNKMGWLTIWNASLAEKGKPPLELSDRNRSQVWRFELRLGKKQLRNKFELRCWHDLENSIGDAFADALSRLHFCEPTSDTNRARWPRHTLWSSFENVVGNDLNAYCSGVLPSEVIFANRAAKMRELDTQITGLLITRAAISDVKADCFEDFVESHSEALLRLTREHQYSLAERLAKSRSRYRLE